MLIVCPSCTTAYRIELSTLGAAGRTVRCARCRATWFASVEAMAPATLALPAVQEGFGPPQAVAEEPGEPDHAPQESAVAQAASGEAASVTIDHSPPLVPA